MPRRGLIKIPVADLASCPIFQARPSSPQKATVSSSEIDAALTQTARSQPKLVQVNTPQITASLAGLKVDSPKKLLVPSQRDIRQLSRSQKRKAPEPEPQGLVRKPAVEVDAKILKLEASQTATRRVIEIPETRGYVMPEHPRHERERQKRRDFKLALQRANTAYDHFKSASLVTEMERKKKKKLEIEDARSKIDLSVRAASKILGVCQKAYTKEVERAKGEVKPQGRPKISYRG